MSNLSRIIFGSMRMHQRELTVADWIGLLDQLSAHGINTYHCSYEYDSFELFCNVMKKLRSKYSVTSRYIVKLATPNFDEGLFDRKLLYRRVDRYLKALDIERIDCVQWMWRSNIDKDALRCKGFREMANQQIAESVEELKAQGKVECIGCFPYTFDFAVTALEKDWIDLLVIYRNPLEREYDSLLDTARDKGKGIVALRPFAAGRVFDENVHSPQSALTYCFGHDAVQSAVVSISSLNHFESLESFVQ